MAHDEHHEHLIQELTQELEPLFSKSPQAIYLYLDDEHKICNQKFADLLGYASIDEWVKNEAPLSDVLEEDHEKVISAYMDASEKGKASILEATVVTKKGENIHTSVIMAPITYKDEVFVLHFITQK